MLPKALFIGFYGPSENSSRSDLIPPFLLFPTASFGTFFKTISCWPIDQSLAYRSLNTSHVSFERQTFDRASAKLSSNFPNLLWAYKLHDRFSKFSKITISSQTCDRMLVKVYCFNSLTSDFFCLWFPYPWSKGNRCQFWYTFSLSPKFLVANCMNKGQAKVGTPPSLVYTSLLQLPKF